MSSDADMTDGDYVVSMSVSVSQTTLKNAPNESGEQTVVPPESNLSSKASTVLPQDSAQPGEQSDEPEDSTEESFGDIEREASGISLNEWGKESEENMTTASMSCSSFSSCESYHTIRKMILRRDPHTSNMSLDSGSSLPQINSCDQLMHQRECRVVGGKDSSHDSMLVVMEPKPNFTQHSCMDISVKEGDIGMEEVYHKFVAWFKRPEIDVAFKVFNEVDQDADGYIALTDLKRGLEKLSVPQTHREAKSIMAQVAGPRCSAVHFSHFLLIYASLLNRLQLDKWPTRDAETDRFSRVDEVDVSQVGVHGARRYFEAKISLEGERLKPLSLMCTQPVARPSSLSSVATSRDMGDGTASGLKKLNEKKE
ncbi:uncharacterized protein [Drosophila pseudoobscura]|uniref:EF-hand domain-containing protein n=1 Tax=Drosophila pseudoobscura pseudoobscura TaxID=46245 RepID=A0A6I8UQR9_DROPS|nr:uncharacterized protein LOC4802393 [Drosophila pseudoobscura]